MPLFALAGAPVANATVAAAALTATAAAAGFQACLASLCTADDRCDVKQLAECADTAAKDAGLLAAGAAGFGLGSALYKPGDDAATVAAKAGAFTKAWAREAG